MRVALEMTLHKSLDSDDDFCAGCQNISHAMSPQTVPLRTTLTSGQSYFIYGSYLYDMTPGFKSFPV